MLVKVDAKAIEWRVKAYLSRDKIAIEEIQNGIDQHGAAQLQFGLPSRLVAKKFNFRMIFADAFSDQGFDKPAWSYSKDPEFSWVSSSQKYWSKVVEAFFTKYSGMYQHGHNLINLVKKEGLIENVSGRLYYFEPKLRGGLYRWPHSEILNYPVQGLAADLLMLARLSLRRRMAGLDLQENKVLLINTVHDDIELDIDNDPELLYNISCVLEDVFQDLPANFEKQFGVKFDVPLMGEVFYGHNLAEMTQFNRELKQEQYATTNRDSRLNS